MAVDSKNTSPHRGESGLARREFMAAVAVGLSGAMPRSAWSQTPNRGGDLVVGLGGAGTGDGLYPAFFNADFMNCVGPQLYDCLTEVDENIKAQPSLAECWDTKPGARDWVFKLRRGVTFHNGKDVTAADVVFSLNHHRGKDSKSAARALVASIAETKAVGKHEIAITLDGGNADMPYILADWHLSIVPEGSTFKDGVGTGPFVLESFEPGVRARTRRNGKDWHGGRGFVETVETLAINDPAARLSALISGSVHLIAKVSPNSVAVLERSQQTQVFNVPGTAHSEFPMHTDTPPYDTLDMRLALKHAIDREAIVKTVLRGHGRVGNDHPIASFDPVFAADLPQRVYDTDWAKFHFKKADSAAPIVLSVSDGAFAGAVDLAQLFQASAAKAGITITLNRVPSDGYYNNVWLKHPFCANVFGGRPTPEMMLSTAYHSNAAWNKTRWRRPKFGELLVAARAELDMGKRKQMYRDMQWMIHEDGGVIIQSFNNFIDGGARKLRGFIPTPNRQLSGYRAPQKVWFEA
ncbi:MAG: ABC transporter substrate-binding protein [Alphaproteobacteria bacterium]|nr:ABC transporter substrate-binding protein [Alphaproteobacteria bacterium]